MSRAKRSFNESRRNELDRVIRNPKKLWKMARKLGLTNGKTKRSDVGKVYDELDVVRQGKEAVGVYMEEILSKCVNEGERSGSRR